MIRWIDGLEGWDGRLPAVLLATDVHAEQRREMLQALAGGSLGIDPERIVIEQARGLPAVVARPIGSGLHLSLGSRGPLTAAAIAASPVGVDVEVVDARGEIPWNVLHADETAMLLALSAELRAVAFARLWSLKEAYLKALGIGLFREPSSFEVRFADQDRALVHDPGRSAKVIDARTCWREKDGTRFAISAILLERCPA